MKWEDYPTTARLQLSKENPKRVIDVLRRDAEIEAKEKLKIARARYIKDPTDENAIAFMASYSQVRSGVYEILLGPVPQGEIK